MNKAGFALKELGVYGKINIIRIQKINVILIKEIVDCPKSYVVQKKRVQALESSLPRPQSQF